MESRSYIQPTSIANSTNSFQPRNEQLDSESSKAGILSSESQFEKHESENSQVEATSIFHPPENVSRGNEWVMLIVKHKMDDQDCDAQEFFVPSQLLTNASPVFATQLNGLWKEERSTILISHFQPADVSVFLDCLQLEANKTARRGDVLVFSPDVIRQILPIAQFYQTDGLKQMVIATVHGLVSSGILEATSATAEMRKSDKEARLNRAAEMVLAIEEIIQDTEPITWPTEIYHVLTARMISTRDVTPWYPAQKSHVKTLVSYNRTEDVLARLSLQTLRKCIQNFSLHANTEVSFQQAPALPVSTQFSWGPTTQLR